MRTRSRRSLGRSLAVTATAAIALLGLVASPAGAAPVKGNVGKKEEHKAGTAVNIDGEKNNPIKTYLYTLILSDGTRVQAYCIDLDTDIVNGAPMVEDDWKNYPNPDTNFKAQPDKVNWILHSSYPHQSVLTELAKAAGIQALNEADAIGATQAAIWHFSNGAKLSTDNDPEVKAVYSYLTGPTNVGLKDEPSASLHLDPKNVNGEAGKKLGPITVNTTAKKVELTFSGDAGAKLVNEQGVEVTTAIDGNKLYVDVPKDAVAGKATIKAEADATVATGRLFRGDGVKTQTLITAKTTPIKVSDIAKASWKIAPSPSPTPSETPSVSPSAPVTTQPVQTTPVANTPQLPVTGAQAGIVAVVGLLLIGGGVALFITTRRRKNAASS